MPGPRLAGHSLPGPRPAVPRPGRRILLNRFNPDNDRDIAIVSNAHVWQRWRLSPSPVGEQLILTRLLQHDTSDEGAYEVTPLSFAVCGLIGDSVQNVPCSPLMVIGDLLQLLEMEPNDVMRPYQVCEFHFPIHTNADVAHGGSPHMFLCPINAAV